MRLRLLPLPALGLAGPALGLAGPALGLAGGLAWGLAGLLAGGPAMAQNGPFDDETSAELARLCASPAPTERDFCFGFLLGAGQFYTEMLRAEVIEPLACPDPVPTIEEMRLGFIDWVAANPEAGETRAVDGMMQAAAEAWPCDSAG